ncbi:MAG: sigma-70 family RNA polymerase sigma factor [Bacteroidales bacterium]|nr:sigma-70 family RNA polymerase sigma factor [Bacteroidales bacterium]
MEFSDENQTSQTIGNGYSYLLCSQLRGDFENAIDRLPEKCRQVFILSRKDDLKNHEIALRLNISNRMVEKHLSRALTKLREALKAYL